MQAENSSKFVSGARSLLPAIGSPGFGAAVNGFAGPSEQALRGGLGDDELIMDPDVSGFLDANGLVDILGARTSRAPLRVLSLAEVRAEDGRRFLPVVVRRLAVLGFIAQQQ